MKSMQRLHDWQSGAVIGNVFRFVVKQDETLVIDETAIIDDKPMMQWERVKATMYPPSHLELTRHDIAEVFGCDM